MDRTPNRQLGLSEWQRIAVLKGAKAVSDLQGATPATPTTNEWGPFVRVHEEADRLPLGGIYVILPICYVVFLKDLASTVGIHNFTHRPVVAAAFVLRKRSWQSLSNPISDLGLYRLSSKGLENELELRSA